MLTLYDYLPSQNGYKIRLLLNQLDRPYRTEIVSIFEGDGQRPEYLAINPTGAVPAIRLEDGRVLAESNAILFHLAEGTRYLPRRPSTCQGAAMDVVRSGLHSIDRGLAALLDADRQAGPPTRGTGRSKRKARSRRSAALDRELRDARIHRGRRLHDRGHVAVRIHPRRARRGPAAANSATSSLDRPCTRSATLSRSRVSLFDRSSFLERAALSGLAREPTAVDRNDCAVNVVRSG